MKSLLRSSATLAASALIHAGEPPNAVDHAGIIQEWNADSLESGKKIYQSLCTNCHGADGKTPPLPTARAFGVGELKFGDDPYAMFLTLTHGNGMMGSQTWMTPAERYAVIHYIRETFMRPMRDDFREINDGYLEGLPTVNVAVRESDKVERDFGPALASQLRRDVSNVLSVKLGDDTTISYDLHRMDQAGLWTGGFLDLQSTQHYRERGGGEARPEGEMVAGLQGWRWAHEGSFDYPTEHLLPRGPLPAKWLNYRGHYLHGDQVVFSYAIDGRDLLEVPTKPPGYGAIEHTLSVGPGKALRLSVARMEEGSALQTGMLPAKARAFELGKDGEIAVMGIPSEKGLEDFVAATVRGDAEGLTWSFDASHRLVLDIPAAERTREFRISRFAGKGAASLLAFASYRHAQEGVNWISPKAMTRGGELRWPDELHSQVKNGSNEPAYTLDTLELPPADNPWNVWFRTSALAFFPDGRMVVSTHGGDVWVVSGLTDSPEHLSWKRFAAGMYEPFGLLVIDDLIHVTCKDRIVRLHDFNQDGEADFYESFSADDDVSVNFHAYNFDLQRDADGNLYYAKSGQYTDYALAGSVIRISPDGRTRDIYCTGLRTPNGMGMMPDGRPTVSDNQGNWMPASKISICDPGGFYGYVQTHAAKPKWAPDGGRIDHKAVVPPKTFDQPIIWMPQDYDNSSGGQLWIDDPRWGPLSNRLLHTSFGKGWLYYLMVHQVDGVDQAAIVKLDLDASTGIQRAHVNPADGQVYAVGLNGWNGSGRKGLSQGGIHRFRYTGATAPMLLDTKVTSEGIELHFNFELSLQATAKSGYKIEQWNYLWARGYGSKQYSVENAWEPGRDSLTPEDVVLLADKRSVLLKLPSLQPVNQMKIDLKLPLGGDATFREQVYLTINKVPGKDLPDMKTLTAERARLWKKQ